MKYIHDVQMKDIKDFETFFSLKIEPNLKDLKSQSETVSIWGHLIFLFAVLGILSMIGTPEYLGKAGGLLIGLFIILFAVSVYKYTSNKDSYTQNFKKKIIQQIIDYLDLPITYKPDGFVASSEYKTSGLYRNIYEYYDGNDYLSGNYKNVSFHCSELHTQWDTANVPADKTELTIFKGLFFVFKLNAGFTGGTYIWTRGEPQLPATIMDEEYRLMHLPPVNKIGTEDAEFNKYFSVYTTYPSQARTILNSELTQQLVHFRKESGQKIQLSVVAGKGFFAVPVITDLLEPKNLENKDEIRNYFLTIVLIIGIVNKLNLSRFN